LVEDEIRVQSFLEEALRREGYLVETASSLDSAAQLILGGSSTYSIVILDRLLGSDDSISLLPLIRQKQKQARVLVLSTLSGAQQKAFGLDQGADDYLGKPFELVELLARLRRLQRDDRQPASLEERAAAAANLSLGDLKILLVEHRVLGPQGDLDLSKKEYHLLLALSRHPGRILSRYQLLDQVWNQQHEIESNVVEVTIKNLRKKLLERGSSAEILTRRGVGYWIEA
jgi:DNA-binding response OmpR family regulator